MRQLVGVIVLGLSAGCGSGPNPTDPCLESEAWATIGTGESAWEDLASGDPVVMVHGPQGGWHMLGSARVGNMGRYVQIHYTITDLQSGIMVADNRYTIALQMTETCTGEFPGMYAYLDVTPLADGEKDTPPELLAYNELEMTMHLSNDYGDELTESLTVIAQPDPKDID